MIDAFEKLDGSKEKIFFRSPTVADYRNYCGLQRDREQAVVTQYLNDLQIVEKNPNKELNDASLWTIHDRLAALYQIFVSTRKRPVLPQSYVCDHCGETHGRELDLLSLAQYIAEIEDKQVPEIELPQDRGKANVVSLTGFAAEFIEDIRIDRDCYDEESQEWALHNVDMRLYEAAFSFEFQDEDKTIALTERVKARYDYLLTLHPEEEYQRIAIDIRKAQEVLNHGLPSTYREGELHVLTPVHDCPVKEGKGTQLLFPFHGNALIPTL